MTEPLSKISSTKEPGKKNAPDALVRHEKKPRHEDESESDSIDISEEARDRAAGNKRRNILDYLNDDPS